MKVCSRCYKEKDDSAFRVRVDKRVGKECTYLNNKCIRCDRERANIYYNKRKNDPEFKRKNCVRAKRYANSNPDLIKMRRSTKEYAEKHAKWNMKSYYRMKDIVAEKMKVKRQTKEYKEKMRNYRERNKDKIYQQEVITKRRYHEKNRDEITDQYVFNILRSQGLFTKDEKGKLFGCTPLIEAKRNQLLIIRKIKNHGNEN